MEHELAIEGVGEAVGGSQAIVVASSETPIDTEANADISTSDFDIRGSLLGLSRRTIDELYNLYRSHACALGFSVRKATTRFSIHNPGEVVEKYFVCSCAGHKAPDGTNSDSSSSAKEKKKKQVAITRTGCKAMLRLKLTGEGAYEVVNHVLAHNHAMTRPEWSYLHRSERKITNEKAEAIANAIGIMKPTQSFHAMVHDAGDERSVGHTLRDHLNYINRLKMKAIEGGDAQKVIDMLYQQSAEEEDFFFRVRMDDNGRLCNLFWRDSMMKEDYGIYGDVTVFDTTYRTNKYNLICAPFVGINNHWKTVMFGCAFLANETSESFEWLFDVFKKSMGGKCPVTIFTDQDLAMSNAIEKVFAHTRHRLCLWHLQQNAASYYGELCTDPTFKDEFKKCLYQCVDEEEFERCWAEMIMKYDLNSNDHPWFARLYKIKEKWCTALSKDFFSAGILSSQRSESTNHAIGFQATKTTSLTDFFEIFKTTIKRWRLKEEYDEFKCSRSIPPSSVPLIGLLKHAAEVYTLNLFADFEKEFVHSMGTVAKIVFADPDAMASTLVYEVSYGSEGSGQRVTYDCVNGLINCSCKYFEECGLLCYHALRIFHIHSVFEIPERYIKTRWTKFAKQEIWDKFDHDYEGSVKRKDFAPWRHDMARKLYNLVLKCQKNKALMKALEDIYTNGIVIIDALISTLAIDGDDESEPVRAASSSAVLDPIRSITKGRSKRIKSHFQTKKQKTSKKGGKRTSAKESTAPSTREFGTKTPTVQPTRLI